MSGNIIKLGGQEFALVKNGVDENQISDFIIKLSQERDALLKELEAFKEKESQLISLNKLAEHTVIEAEKMARDIQRDLTDKTNNECKKLLEVAVDNAGRINQECRTQAESAVTKLVEEMKIKVLDLEQTLKRNLGKTFIIQTQTASAIPSDNGNNLPVSESDYVEGEIEIQPPINLTLIMQLIKALDNMVEVASTELVPLADRPLILINLRSGCELVQLLNKIDLIKSIESPSNSLENNRQHVSVRLQ